MASQHNFDIEWRNNRLFGRRVVRRYRNAATDFSYEVVFDDAQWEGRRLLDMSREMDRVWTGLVERVLGDGAHTDDLIRLHISHDVLTHGDIIVSLRRIKDMTPDAIWGSIENILQSYQTMAFDDSLRITVGVIRLPRGAGRAKMTNREESITSKKSVVRIENTDMMCMARALVVCEGYHQHKSGIISPYEYERLRKDVRNAQTRGAHDLHTKAGVATHSACGLEQLQAFETALNAEVVVFSAETGNRIIYPAGLKNDGRPVYYIYYTGNHYHAINSASGFLGESNFCNRCLRAYQRKHKHQCPSLCDLCKSPECTNHGTKRVCGSGHFAFNGLACFVRHNQRNAAKKEKSICELRQRCVDCHKITENGQPHNCDEYMCPSCKAMVPIDSHKCFMFIFMFICL